MKVELKRINDNIHFEATGTSDVKINIDGSPQIGGENKGARPMELLLMGLGSCSAIDIIQILKKQKQKITDFDITIEAKREEGKIPSLFESITVCYKLKGEIKDEKLKRAIDLSVEKYCSVSALLNKTASIDYSYELNKAD